MVGAASGRPMPVASPDGDLLVRHARIVDLDEATAAPEPVDVRIREGLIAELGQALPTRGEPELDAAGHWVIPGLWDAHVHATQAARASTWFDVSGSASAAEVLDLVVARLAEIDDSAPTASVIGFGYRRNGWPEPASTAALDAVTGNRPVALLAGDAHNGWLNSAAQRALGLRPVTDALEEDEWFTVFARLHDLPGLPGVEDSVDALARAAAAQGVTGLVDFEFADAYLDWPRRTARGLTCLRVRTAVYPHQLDDVLARGLRTGDVLDAAGLVTMGSLKVITDGSLGTATAWCHHPYANSPADPAQAHGVPNLSAEALHDLAARGAAHGLTLALHAIGDRACTQVLDVIAAVGATGTMEHAQLLDPADLPRFAELGVAASVQPLHLVDDRDIADASWPGQTGRAFAFRSLLDAGADVRLGSDAPVARLDPWGGMAAAVHRSSDDRPSWHPEQAITPAAALAASVDGQRIRPGARGDVVVLGADPLWEAPTTAETAAALRAMPVLATVCAGRITHEAVNR